VRHTPAMESALLAFMSAQEGPVGARAAARHLRECGFDVSESTVSRLLNDLDERALSQSLGKKGRILTEEGNRVAANQQLDSQRESYFAEALALHYGHSRRNSLTFAQWSRRAVRRAGGSGSPSTK